MQSLSVSPGPAQPRVLFVSVMNDVGSDRIVAAMGRLGCECAVLAPPDAFAALSRFASRHFALPRHGGAFARTFCLAGRLARAVHAWRPDLIVPLDDCCARSLRSSRLLAQVGNAARLIEASLGDRAHYPTVNGREALVEAAAAIGLRTPRQTTVAGWDEARYAADAFGYPVVLKREQTCGGFGVDIVRDEAALAHAYGRARRKATAKRRLQDVLGLDRAGGDGLILQAYVSGPLAFRTVSCANGRVLDGVSFLADTIHPPVTGASTVLRPLREPEMESATRALVARLGCSGFVSVDFILSPEGATLIELNPRPVASGHLGRLYGHDIHSALVSSLTGSAVAPSLSTGEGPAAIALFPRELDRDPASPVFDTPFAVLHDVPWDDADVLAYYAAWIERRHAGQVDVLRRHLPPTGLDDVSWRSQRAAA